MKRRNFLQNAGTVAVLAGAGTAVVHACSPSATHEQNGSTAEQIAHYVLFWLKEGLSEEEVNDFAGFFEKLKSIPGIKSLHYGRAATTNPRPVVDNSFTYNLLVFFDSMEDIHVYETHPIHLEAIEQYSKYWDKVMVHDSLLKPAAL